MLRDLKERCPNMRELTLIKSNLSNVSIENLPYKLKILTITHCMIPPGWFSNVIKEEVLDDLENLDLSNSTKTSNRDLKDISGMASLKNLTLNGCYRITEDGLKAVVENMVNLEVLELSSTSCTDLVFHIMCRNMGKLKDLNMSECKGVTGGGLGSIGSGLKNLESLNISGCEAVTDDTLPHFQNMKKLQQLDIRNTKATPAGVDRLLVELPNCKVLILE